MSEMRPVGTPVMMDGVERKLLFTLNAIDEIQDHYDKPIDDVIEMMMDEKETLKAMRYLMHTLLEDERQRESEKEFKEYTEQEIGWFITKENLTMITIAILKAYGLSIPEPDEDESPN